jgi:hypothetical protein
MKQTKDKRHKIALFTPKRKAQAKKIAEKGAEVAPLLLM